MLAGITMLGLSYFDNHSVQNRRIADGRVELLTEPSQLLHMGVAKRFSSDPRTVRC